MKTGDKLPNGATVLLEQSGVILAANPKTFRHFGQEFVTWQWDGQNFDSTTWGHYHESIVEAAKDFEARVAHKESGRAA